MFYSLALPPVSGPGGGRRGNQQKELTTRTQFWPLDRKWTQSVGLFSCMWFRSLLCSVVSLAALLGAFAVGGCAYQLNSLAAKSTMEAAAKHDEKPSEVDLAYARAVAAAAFARGDKNNSISWQNPNTGAGGYITPLALSYTEGTSTCRDFLASYLRERTEAWLQGEACRTDHGKWEVKSLGVKRSRDPT